MKAGPRLRILYCLDAFEGPSSGGTETQFWMLINRLSRERFDVALALLKPSRWLRDHPPDFPVIELNVERMASPVTWLRLARFALWARRERFDIAHTFLNDVSICLPPLLKMAGVRVVVSRRDLGFWFTPGILRALRVTRHFVDRAIVNCTAVADVTEREERYAREDIDIVFNGNTRMDAPPAPFVAHRANPSLVLVANLKAIKRLDIAIRALALVRERGHAAILTLVGEAAATPEGAEYRAGLEELATSLGVRENVHFAGRVTEPASFLASADVCLLCSDSEGLSNAIIEYLFAGAAIVCTDVGGARDLVEAGVTGLLVPAGDFEQLATCIVRLLDDPEARRAMGERAREAAQSRFSARAMLDAHEAIYRRVAAD